MKNTIYLIITILSLTFLSSCGGSSAQGDTKSNTKTTTVGAVSNVDAATFKKLMDENAGTLIDVRTPREFQAGAIPGTKLNVNVSDRNFKTEIGKLDKDKTYLVYCLSGARSSHAARIMESMGFKHLYNLKGGYRGWKGAGF